MKLPNEFENTKLIRNMQIGQVGYVIPQAMWVDVNMDCWLYLDYVVHKTPSGDIQLKIKRMDNGYIAYLYDMESDYLWQPIPTPEYEGIYTQEPYGYVIGFGSKNIIEKIKNLFN